jgi:Short C-terminal domain
MPSCFEIVTVMRVTFRDAKGDARHQERVAEERRKLRVKAEEKAANRRVYGTVNVHTLGYDIMQMVDPVVVPTNVEPKRRQSVRDAVGKSSKPVVYTSGEHEYTVLTPPAPKPVPGTSIFLVIVRGPAPLGRAMVIFQLDEQGSGAVLGGLPGPQSWIETANGDTVGDYESEFAAWSDAVDALPDPSAPAAQETDDAVPDATNVVAALERLVDLRDAGALTPDEFETAKQQVFERN